MVAGSAFSGPASTSMWNSETSASGEAALLVTARVTAPASRAALVEATRSGEPPDWLTVITRTSVRSGVAPYAVVVDIEVSPAGLPSRISIRYLAYSAALSDVPRAVSRTKRGLRAAISAAMARIFGAPSSRMRWRTAGCSAISAAMIRPGTETVCGSDIWVCLR